MTLQTSPTPDSPSSWTGFKNLARQQYESGDYEAALTSYTSALNSELHCPASEQQILLSNLVACRLKIGGPAQARAAIENAKKCIALNPEWAKGHVRLASAYIALGGHSNDACNELQRALSIDPGNSTARDMLVRELRRDHARASRSSSSNTTTDTDNAGSHTDSNQNVSYAADNNYSDFDNNHNSNSARPPQQEQEAMDDSLTWSERFEFHLSRARTWYYHQSDDVKTIFKIGLVLLVLYVGFGGRFGLDNSSGRHRMGNYGSDNAYDQYQRYGTTQSSLYRDHHNRNNQRHNYGTTDHHGRRRTAHYDDYYSSDNSEYSYGGGGTSSIYNSYGGMQSVLLLGGIVLGAHYLGMNPFQTMMMLNMMGGGRRARFIRPGRGFGFGGMMGGFGRGGMRYNNRRRF